MPNNIYTMTSSNSDENNNFLSKTDMFNFVIEYRESESFSTNLQNS